MNRNKKEGGRPFGDPLRFKDLSQVKWITAYPTKYVR